MQLVVDYLNGQTRYYPVTFGSGWKIDTMHRCLTVGYGVPRMHIPLDTVAAFHIEHEESE